MRLFSYVVARDYGFAPNPFFASCTLATCKPIIRRIAEVGDWVVGTGSATKGKTGHLVFAMRVSEAMTYNEYFSDARYERKKPNLRGSIKQAFGDNIYNKNKAGRWDQLDSHHSYTSGAPNPHNIRNDTQTDRVLLSDVFAYFGGVGPEIPKSLRNYGGFDVCARRNHKSRFPEKMVEEFILWIQSLRLKGYVGAPADWR